MNRYYGASVFPVDYRKASEEARTRINSWVEDRTQGKIRNIIQKPLDPDTSLVLVNAIYFKRHVDLPKFRITWGAYDLIRPLQALGVRKAFGGGADFSGMDGTKAFRIGLLLHKAFVEVNEEGTEAAAATVAVRVLGGSLRVRTFRADHPFLFVIRDNATGSILFLGRILDPDVS